MTGKSRLPRWLLGAALLAAIDGAGLTGADVALMSSAQAQGVFPFFGGGGQQNQRSRSGGGFFGGLFGGFDRPSDNYEQQAPVDNSRAPPPRKPDPKADPVTVTTSIVVLGDAMADWLAYGMEDAFSDSPEIAVVRKNKLHSGLIRYEQKSDLDWWRVARDILAQEKANYVVMMLGVSDRQAIRERDLAKEAERKKGKDQKDQKDQTDKPAAEKEAQGKRQSDEQEQAGITAPETQPSKRTGGVVEFRTDQWAEIYSKRIDETIAALKSKGVPIFWVGLPSLRGAKSTADAVYLNDLFRARAERAGVIYVDIWDGFVDESGKYSNFGPDYEGQMRRLRSQDGVFFTKSGAVKLAHYVEREIRRHMNSRVAPVALPAGPLAPATPDGRPAARPVAGPVIPLTVVPGNSEELLGGAGNSSPHADAIATRVLVKGEPVAAPRGRADNFALQPGNDDSSAAPPTVTPPGALASAPAEPARIEPAATEAAPAMEKKTAAPTNSGSERTAQNTGTRPKPPPRPSQRDDVPRPPRGIPFGGSWPFR